jgi:hypothetical protein
MRRLHGVHLPLTRRASRVDRRRYAEANYSRPVLAVKQADLLAGLLGR